MSVAQDELPIAPGVQSAAELPFHRQFSHMAAAGWQTRERRILVVLAIGLVSVVGATAWMQIRLNAWNEPFYNAISKKDVAGFITQLQVFAVLAGLLLTLNVIQLWLNQTMKLTMRRSLVSDLLDVWLKPERPFRLTKAGPIGQNPDQRLQADALHLADLTIDLGVGLLQASLLLSAFIGVLWSHSEGMTLAIGGGEYAIPGFMVWCALLYATVASWLSWMVGRPMIALNAERYSREGAFRFELVRISEDAEGVALHRGEARERSRLDGVFRRVVAITRTQIRAMTRLTWVTAGYGWFTIVAPILAASPFYFYGDMTLGELMLVVGAFNQVQGSLRWFIDNFPAIADWRATLLRVSSFRMAMVALEADDTPGSRMTIERYEAADIVLEDVEIASPAGMLRLAEPAVALAPGERVRVTGDYGAGKTMLFHALAGLWPWGKGRIFRPGGARVLFMPAKALVSPGPLRDCVTYPFAENIHADEAIRSALATVGLGRLADELDRDERWDRLLSESEKQCLAMTRVLLHRPDWVIADDVFHNMDAASRELVMELFAGPLQGTGVIYMGPGGGMDGFFGRTIALVAEEGQDSVDPASAAIIRLEGAAS